MIKPETVSEIFEAARIEDVVGDFVHLKKRGSNMIGLCPFHNEKTPSFNVSPSKGIYKCFGCGQGGNSVNFIMEHEHLNYPEALKYLAKKYNIEVEEKELSPEERRESDERESLMLINEAAQQFFIQSMLESDEGKSIGGGYFKERGLSAKTIERFALGYCPEGPEGSFSQMALDKGFRQDYLQRTGLTKEGRNGLYDFFHGRVIFPIRSISGRPLGFGARTLRNDKKIAKYFNSPESIVYNKSKVLYGLYESRSAIVKKDLCYMVEGYMDVISLHQAGVQNVVASSGTSLTEGQIRLVHRYTPNITILYDSDAAGVKAAMRGIELLLEEGMKLRVIELPEGEDPDSLAQKFDAESLEKHLNEEAKDFFTYMCDQLLSHKDQDPIERSKAIQEIIMMLALVPDKIARNLETQKIALKLQLDQRVVNNEIFNAQQKHAREKEKRRISQERSAQRQNLGSAPGLPPDVPPPPFAELAPNVGFEGSPPPGMDSTPLPELEQQLEVDRPMESAQWLSQNNTREQELDIIRLLLNYGQAMIKIEVETEEGSEEETEEIEVSVEDFILEDLSHDHLIKFKDPFASKVWAMYQSAYAEERSLDPQVLMRHPDRDISRSVAELLSEKHELHRWEDRQIYPVHEKNKLLEAVDGALGQFKLKTVMNLIKETQASLRSVEHDVEALQETLMKIDRLNKLKSQLSEVFGTVILNT